MMCLVTDCDPSFADPNQVPSRLDEAPSLEFSILTLSSGWPEDLERLVTSLATTSAGQSFEVVAAANASGAVEDLLIGRAG